MVRTHKSTNKQNGSAKQPKIVFVSRFDSSKEVIYKLDKMGKLMDHDKITGYPRLGDLITKLPPKLKIKFDHLAEQKRIPVTTPSINSNTEMHTTIIFPTIESMPSVSDTKEENTLSV